MITIPRFQATACLTILLSCPLLCHMLPENSNIHISLSSHVHLSNPQRRCWKTGSILWDHWELQFDPSPVEASTAGCWSAGLRRTSAEGHTHGVHPNYTCTPCCFWPTLKICPASKYQQKVVFVTLLNFELHSSFMAGTATLTGSELTSVEGHQHCLHPSWPLVFLVVTFAVLAAEKDMQISWVGSSLLPLPFSKIVLLYRVKWEKVKMQQPRRLWWGDIQRQILAS